MTVTICERWWVKAGDRVTVVVGRSHFIEPDYRVGKASITDEGRLQLHKAAGSYHLDKDAQYRRRCFYTNNLADLLLKI